MLAALYLATGRASEAEQPLKAVADISKAPAARFQLADYYVSVGRTKDAASLLTPLAADPATFAEAESRLATLDYAEGRVPEAHKRLDAVLARVPNQAPALVIKAQWLTTENKLDEALDVAKAAVAADPDVGDAPISPWPIVHDRRREAGRGHQVVQRGAEAQPARDRRPGRAVQAEPDIRRRRSGLAVCRGSPPGGPHRIWRPAWRWRGASSPPAT